jgi:hypothetical protein
VIADSALYAQLMISLAHSAPATLSEICTGTPAAANKATTSALRANGPITSSPRPWCFRWPGPAISVAT